MNINIIPQLDETNSVIATPLPETTKKAILVWESANYTVPWGLQTFEGPHMLVDNEYGCALDEFFSSHKAIKQEKNTWYKCVPVRAMITIENMKLQTLITSDGNQEVVYEEIPAGTFIVRNPKGEQYCMDQDSFKARYEISNTNNL